MRKPRRQAIAGTVPDQSAVNATVLSIQLRWAALVDPLAWWAATWDLFPLVPGKLCTAVLCALMVFPSYPQIWYTGSQKSPCSFLYVRCLALSIDRHSMLPIYCDAQPRTRSTRLHWRLESNKAS